MEPECSLPHSQQPATCPYQPFLFKKRYFLETVHKNKEDSVLFNDESYSSPQNRPRRPRVLQVYSSTLSLTSALDWGGWSMPTPTALLPAKTRYPLYRRLGGSQGWSGRVRKISPPTGIGSPDRPARSESLYRLSYPGPVINHMHSNSVSIEKMRSVVRQMMTSQANFYYYYYYYYY